MEKSGKEGSMKVFFIVMLVSLAIASLWESVPIIKETVHSILNPSAGVLLNWNLTIGFLLIIFVISVLTTLIQKYTTDQKTLKEMRKEQKLLQKEMQKYRDDPQKMMELNKKSMEFIPKTMKLTTRSIAYTAVPLILLFRWFMDFFTELGNPKFFGFLGWFLFYLIGFMIISSIVKKVLKVV